MRCSNCGGELPGRTRFCPHCSAPWAVAVDGREVVSRRSRRSYSHRLAFSLLVFLASAALGFAAMAFGLGWAGGVLGL
jgi:predicted amidophosphoribosyltransferase